MATLILYRSKHGTTLKAVEILRGLLNDSHIDVFDVRRYKKIDLNAYNTFVIGGSIHAGKIQKHISVFINKQSKFLLEKELGLFLCCMEQRDKAIAQFNMAFSEELRLHARATALFGGEFTFEKMNFFERLIIKKITGSTKSISNINLDEIKGFAEKINAL